MGGNGRASPPTHPRLLDTGHPLPLRVPVHHHREEDDRRGIRFPGRPAPVHERPMGPSLNAGRGGDGRIADPRLPRPALPRPLRPCRLRGPDLRD